MTDLAIIGGSGLSSLDDFVETGKHEVNTPYGPPSSALFEGELAGVKVLFLARHGIPHAVPPHRVNYRANCRALMDAGVRRIIAVNAVGGITESMLPGCLVVPDQIIDYTWSREHTYSDGDPHQFMHVDFTRPYDEQLCHSLLDCARDLELQIHAGGTYGATQGPRLETAAEIDRMERDGCDIVGMTGMPEASLARELNVAYASICMVVNRAAGRAESAITEELIQKNLAGTTAAVMALLKAALPRL